MSDKRRRLLKILIISLAAGLCTLLVSYAAANWGSKYREIPENASEWKEPENEEVRAKVEEITGRIMAGGEYGFDELLYVMDHDSAAGRKITDYLIEQGKKAISN